MKKFSSRFAQLRGDDNDRSLERVLEQNPGAIAKDVSAATGLSEYTTRYRLLTLELAGLVRSTKERNRVRYYLKDSRTYEDGNDAHIEIQNSPNKTSDAHSERGL
jgi:predicted transcriptional regulator